MIVEIEEYELDGSEWLANFTATLSIEPGIQGSYSRDAPSDVDYWGRPTRIDSIDEIVVTEIVDSETMKSIPMEQWELRAIARHITMTIDYNELIDAAEEYHECWAHQTEQE